MEPLGRVYAFGLGIFVWILGALCFRSARLREVLSGSETLCLKSGKKIL